MNKNNDWINEYINGVDLNEIKWIKLNSSELEKFFKENYFDEDEKKYVSNDGNTLQRETPLGLYYLSFNFINNDYSFLLGITNNTIGKKTIIANIMFLENEFLFYNQKTPITYISSVEVNYYFRNKGIYKKMCKAFTSFLNFEQHIVISKQSKMGEKCKVFDILKTTLEKEGFYKKILIDNNLCEMELSDIICDGQKILKKLKK